jgi:hypothetical protein
MDSMRVFVHQEREAAEEVDNAPNSVQHGLPGGRRCGRGICSVERRTCDSTDSLILFLLHAFPAQRQGASADELHVKAAKSFPLLDSPDPSKTQPTEGTDSSSNSKGIVITMLQN